MPVRCAIVVAMDGQAEAKRGNKGQRTAGRILDAAEELFARQGYEGTALRDIAEQAAIQQPGLYKHFASKDDLYRRVYERALAPLFALMDNILTGPVDVDFPGDLVARLTDLLALHPNIARLLVRAAINPVPQTDEIATEWLERLINYGAQLTEKAGYKTDRRTLTLQVMAVFNTLLGYFSAMPLIERLAGARSDDPATMEIQKDILRGLIASFTGAAPPESR